MAAALLAVAVSDLAGSASAADPCLEALIPAKAVEVLDSRSLRLDDGRLLRLAGIEPFNLLRPELEGAEVALLGRLVELVAGSDIEVANAAEEPDRHGRIPGLISVGDGLVQETLAREGLGVAFAGGDMVPCFDRILAAEAEARRARRGFWDAAALPYARAETLRPQIGAFVIFEGVVLTVGTRPATTYLNFGDWWAEDVTIEIVAKDRALFGGEAALAGLAGSRVRARGYLQEKAGPMLAVRSPMQLEILDAPAAAEGVKP